MVLGSARLLSLSVRFLPFNFTPIRYGDKAQSRGGGTDNVGHIGLGQVGVVFLRDPRIGMTELLGNNLQGHALHRQSTGVGVAQHVEADGRDDTSGGARAFERSRVVGFGP